MRPIPQGLFPQRDFSGGQIDEEAMRRDDLNIVLAALRVGENLQIGPPGNATRRPGSNFAYQTNGRMEQFAPYSDLLFDCIFYGTHFISVDTDGVITQQNITGLPWSSAEADEMEIEEVDNTIVVTHHNWKPVVLSYDRETTLWTRADFTFQVDPNGASREPFYRFGTPGVTMQPSALTGSIDIEFSDDVLLPEHAGTIFRYGERQIMIDTVVDPQHATGTVLEELPKTHKIGVTAGVETVFAVGDIVEGTSSGLSGVVSRLEAGFVYVVAYKQAGETFDGDDILVGPRGRAPVDNASVPTETTDIDPIFVWDEEFMSDVRGWPGGVSYPYNRLTFYRFVQQGRAYIMSSPGSPDDFKETGEPDGAIFEFVKNGNEVRHIRAGTDLFLLLNNSVYFTPVSASTPLAPGQIEPIYIGAIGASIVRPEITNEGLVYVSDDSKRVMAIVPTGQQTQPYTLENVARYHSHLINTPIALASSRGSDNAPGDYIYIVNMDGSLAVGRYDPVNKWIGLVPWVTFGNYTAASSRHTDVVFTLHAASVGAFDFIVKMTNDRLLDGAVPFADPTIYYDASYAGATVAVVDGDEYLGLFQIDGDGVMINPPTGHPNAYFGFAFVPRIQPIVPNFAGGSSQRQRLRRRRINTAMITVRGTTGFQFGSKLIPHWKTGESQEEPPPRRDTSYRIKPLGRHYDPTFEISQPVPGPFDMIELTVDCGA